ncbi:thiamine diphosphokinase [Planomicrobium chinense]|uniref:thiamine diphosphokinase n=1 Tax=Planococcus chinensis TaxID=272917 RepID=UPI001CC59BD7|nr:thiamine diphosphokinase [Planococcus chinensis]MBZ5200259.1 thiamine diphosphokinase [Planococcus chinensis]
MIVVVNAGGPVKELPDFSLWPSASYIGVDAGTIVLLERGIQPAAAVGDFDSVSAAEMAKIKKLFPKLNQAAAEKDETDTELALEKAMEFSPDTVIVTGVTGGRLDHYMSALHAIYKYQEKFQDTSFVLVNRQNRIRFLAPGTHRIQPDLNYRYISFYPFAQEVRGFKLEKFKYEVDDEVIPFGSTRFISNELETEGIVSFASGSCIVIESTDQ